MTKALEQTIQIHEWIYNNPQAYPEVKHIHNYKMLIEIAKANLDYPFDIGVYCVDNRGLDSVLISCAAVCKLDGVVSKCIYSDGIQLTLKGLAAYNSWVRFRSLLRELIQRLLQEQYNATHT